MQQFMQSVGENEKTVQLARARLFVKPEHPPPHDRMS